MERAHGSVCFVSGYLAASAGRCTRGLPWWSGGLQMEGFDLAVSSFMFKPPAWIMGERPERPNSPILALKSMAASGGGSRALFGVTVACVD